VDADTAHGDGTRRPRRLDRERPALGSAGRRWTSRRGRGGCFAALKAIGDYDAPHIFATQNVHAPISAAMGIVKTNAQTMRPATPQRTAESLRMAPTPTMAPVMVCVVETGMPNELAKNSVAAPGGLRGEAADRLQLGDFRPHGVDAPAAG